MKKILWIGAYNQYGVFDSNNWKQFVIWLKKNCDMVEIYTNINSNHIHRIFGGNKILNEYVFEGMENYHSFKITCDDNVIDILSHWNYNIDKLNISHIFFYFCQREYGSITIEDFGNCIVLDWADIYLEGLIDLLDSVQDNIKLCLKYKEDIDGIAEDDWLPIGVKESVL